MISPIINAAQKIDDEVFSQPEQITSRYCTYDIRCELPMEFFIQVEGPEGLSDEEVLKLVNKENFASAPETIIGSQTYGDLEQRCIEAWDSLDCQKMVF